MAISALKDLLKIAKAINNFELNQKLIELQQELMQLQDENRALKDRLRELQEQRDRGKKAHWANDAYWLPNDGDWDGPFCSGCYDGDGRLIRLTKLETAFHGIATHECPKCHQTCSPKKPG